MSDAFTFEMGEYTASFPSDRKYAANHMWATEVHPRRWRFGLTAYAVRLLQDVYFLDWIMDPPQPIAHRQHIGSIESKKAESDLYAPLAGTLTAINGAVVDDPSLINADTYREGWLVEIDTDQDQHDVLLSAEGYAKHLVDAWDVAQRTIKGQANV